MSGSTARFALNEEATRTYLTAVGAAWDAWRAGTVDEMPQDPEIFGEWTITDSGEGDAQELLEALIEQGTITGLADRRVYVDWDTSGEAEFVSLLLGLPTGDDGLSWLELATTSSEARKIGERDSQGVDAAVEFAQFAVERLNQALQALEQFMAPAVVSAAPSLGVEYSLASPDVAAFVAKHAGSAAQEQP